MHLFGVFGGEWSHYCIFNILDKFPGLLSISDNVFYIATLSDYLYIKTVFKISWTGSQTI